MSFSSKICIMISSNCNAYFPIGQKKTRLSDTRQQIKEEIENCKIFDKKIFEVWINEQTPSQSVKSAASDVCRDAAKKCDIFISIYNGNAGAPPTKGTDGLCHQELHEARANSPDKIRIIYIIDPKSTELPQEEHNLRFQEYVNSLQPFRTYADTNDDLVEHCKKAIQDALIKLTHLGSHDKSTSIPSDREALEWHRLDFENRAKKMRRTVFNTFNTSNTSISQQHAKTNNELFLTLNGKKILIVVHAVPAALSIDKAKEMVGQPFLNDHIYAEKLKKGGYGPIHVIACHKTATEAQAIKLLGFPEATIVSAPFGIFVADNIQKIQFALINSCYDEASTRKKTNRLLEWLHNTGETKLLIDRAISRTSIVRAIAKELNKMNI